MTTETRLRAEVEHVTQYAITADECTDVDRVEKDLCTVYSGEKGCGAVFRVLACRVNKGSRCAQVHCVKPGEIWAQS